MNRRDAIKTFATIPALGLFPVSATRPESFLSITQGKRLVELNRGDFGSCKLLRDGRQNTSLAFEDCRKLADLLKEDEVTPLTIRGFGEEFKVDPKERVSSSQFEFVLFMGISGVPFRRIRITTPDRITDLDPNDIDSLGLPAMKFLTQLSYSDRDLIKLHLLHPRPVEFLPHAKNIEYNGSIYHDVSLKKIGPVFFLTGSRSI